MYRSWGLSRPILDGLYKDFPYKTGFTRKYNTSVLGALEGTIVSSKYWCLLQFCYVKVFSTNYYERVYYF